MSNGQPNVGSLPRAGQCPVPASPGKLREVTYPEPALAVVSGWEDWRAALQPIPAFVGWYRKHKVSGTLLLTGFVVVKGYVVARGDITTALGIEQYAGVAGWAVAAVLSSLPTLAAAMLAIGCYQILWPLIGRHLASWRQMLTVVWVAFFVCAAVTPWPVWLGAIVLGFAFGGLQWLAYKARKHHTISIFLRLSLIAVLVGEVSAAVAMLYTAWLPNENIKFNKQAVAANVLAEDSGGWITLLISSSREIIRRKDDSVSSITDCSFRPHGGFSDIYDAPTPWVLVTTKWAPLHSLAPGRSEECSHKKQAHQIHWKSVLTASLFVLALAVIVIIPALRAANRKPNHISISRPYGRWPATPVFKVTWVPPAIGPWRGLMPPDP